MKLNYHFFFERDIDPVHEDIDDSYEEGRPLRNSVIEAIKMLRFRR